MSRTGPEGLPWPDGEPAALTGAAGQLRAMAGRLAAAGTPLGGAATVDHWHGGAATAYSMLVHSQVTGLQGSATVFGSTAAALRALAQVLSDAQDAIRADARNVRDAREAAERARALAGSAASRSGAAPDNPGAEAAFLHLSAAAGRAEADYREIRQAAVIRAQRLVAEVDAADAATAGEVAEARVAATAGPGGLPAAPGQIDIDPVALAWRYAPHLRFHPDEQNLPADLRAALANGTLTYRDGRWFVDLPDGSHPGESFSAPVDFNVVERDGKRYVVYRVFYNYNDKTAFGDHEGDLELFTVELDDHDRPVAALYYGHGKPHRVPWAEVRRDGTHPVSYVASGSHASYPQPGHYPIAKGLGTDEAAGGGPRGDTERNLHPGPDHYRLPGGTRLPPGTRIGETGESPLAPNTGANTEPYPAGSTPTPGAPDPGDGLDGKLRGILDAAGSPIEIGRGALGLL
ncbi:MAG TPA: hypothetical protein VMU51_26930 [Mycobacteriales bacterium]|nr:hypothetical protein [Mycobacteriales bacterium]